MSLRISTKLIILLIGLTLIVLVTVLTAVNNTFTVADPLCTTSSTCFWTWVGPLPGEDPVNAGLFYSDVHVNVEAQAGQWVFYIKNDTPWMLTGFQLSVVAFYGP